MQIMVKCGGFDPNLRGGLGQKREISTLAFPAFASWVDLVAALYLGRPDRPLY